LVEDIFGAITELVPQQANIFIPVLQINLKFTTCGLETVGALIMNWAAEEEWIGSDQIPFFSYWCRS
jgi:hypothetical protein